MSQLYAWKCEACGRSGWWPVRLSDREADLGLTQDDIYPVHENALDGSLCFVNRLQLDYDDDALKREVIRDVEQLLERHAEPD